jgi:RimJ/RimL family protein N-acetyltransferase
VERYHVWMQDPFLLEATGSEPLSMEDEVAHQKSWYEDENKCTFLVLARELLDDNVAFGSNDFIPRQLHAMVGDVNLFLSDELQEDDIEINEDINSLDDMHGRVNHDQVQRQAEVDIMIAEASFRGKGLGEEATILMMIYGVAYIPGTIRRLFVKIQEDNMASINLFQKKLGFVEKQYISVFQQYEFELRKESHAELLDYLTALFGRELETFSFPSCDK